MPSARRSHAPAAKRPIIEARSLEAHHGPIEAQEIMPPIEAGDEDDEAGQETAEGAPAENGGQQEPEREGARKWRGRRRRGRGGRDRFADRGASDRARAEPGSGDRDRPVEAVPEEHDESPEESRPEPRHDRQESRPESRYESRHEHRHEGRSEQRFEQHRPEPILLPGESISKYQPQGAQSTAPRSPVITTEAQLRPRPSTEYSLDPSAFSAGSFRWGAAGRVPGQVRQEGPAGTRGHGDRGAATGSR